jgi:DNA gyrase subunit A
VIACANQKGGVAKTTTVIHLGVAIAELGKRVLLVDLDPQGHLAEGFGIVSDRLAVEISDGSEQIFLGTRDGMAIRFAESDVRPMGRTAYGVRGISLRGDDFVVSMEVVKPGGTLLTVTERGFGKRTEIEEYRVQSRGGVGIINIATTTKNGLVVGVAYVQEGDELLLITQQGMILRMATDDVRAIGRATQGVTLINIEAEDKVVSIAKLVEKDDKDEEEPNPPQ